MPKYCVKIDGGTFEIDDATDEDDAREQACEQLSIDVELMEDDDDEDEDDDGEAEDGADGT